MVIFNFDLMQPRLESPVSDCEQEAKSHCVMFRLKYYGCICGIVFFLFLAGVIRSKVCLFCIFSQRYLPEPKYFVICSLRSSGTACVGS